MKLNNLILALAVLCQFFIICPLAKCGVDDSWDWNDGKRTLKVWINVPAGTKLGGVGVSDAVRAAMNKINNSHSGWQLGIGTADDHDIEVKLEDIDEDVGGARETFPLDKNRRVSKATLTIDPTPKGGETWGANGNCFDPVTVMLHELLHKCRIDHQAVNGDTVGTTGNAADPSLTGERQRTLSKDDINDLKDANAAPIRKIIQKAGPGFPGAKNLSIDTTSVTFPDWTFYTDVEIGLSLTSDCETVINPFSIPDYNNYRIIRGVLLDITGAYTYSAQGQVSFRLAYLDKNLDDPETLPVNEQSLSIFIYNIALSGWYPAFPAGISHDTVNNFMDFSLEVDYLLSPDNFGYDPCNPATCFTFLAIGGLETPRLKAGNPAPLNGSSQIEIAPTLTWTPGYLAQPDLGNAVYLGTDYNEVFNATTDTPGIFKGRQTSFSYALSGLQADTNYYWRIDEFNDVEIQSPWKGRIWRFTTIGGACANPVPVSGTVGLPVSVELNWTSGAFAAAHLLFFGTDEMTVTDASTGNPLGVYIGTVARPYSLGNLPFDLARDINYYWRVDEVNASNPYSPWKGEIWMFRNTDYLVIDDFNSYLGSDDMNQRWQTNYDLSPACYTNAQAGLHWDDNNQLMQFYYDNTGLYGVYFSEDRLDANGDDWTGAGALPAGDPVVALAISYLGNAFNTADPTYDRMYIGLEDIHGDFNMVLNPDPNAARNFYQWNQWNIALADLGVPSPVNLSAVKYLYLGFGERCNYYVPGGSGTVLFDDLRLYQRRCVPDLNSPPGDFSHDCRVDLYDVEVMSQEWLSEGIVADIYPQGSRDYIVNFRDFAVLAGKWLTETVWP